MNTGKELYQRKPRLYRVACELSKFDDPHKALDLLLALVESAQKKEEEANHE